MWPIAGDQTASMTDNVIVEPISVLRIEGLRCAVDAVSRGGRFLRTSQGFSFSQTSDFVHMILSGAGVQYIARSDDQVIGWCDIVRQPFDGMRHAGALGIGVLEDYRGRGIGKQLMQATLAAAADAGITRIELEVFAPNTTAIALYKRFGFEVEGVKRCARIIDDEANDIICMALLN